MSADGSVDTGPINITNVPEAAPTPHATEPAQQAHVKEDADPIGTAELLQTLGLEVNKYVGLKKANLGEISGKIDLSDAPGGSATAITTDIELMKKDLSRVGDPRVLTVGDDLNSAETSVRSEVNEADSVYGKNGKVRDILRSLGASEKDDQLSQFVNDLREADKLQDEGARAAAFDAIKAKMTKILEEDKQQSLEGRNRTERQDEQSTVSVRNILTDVARARLVFEPISKSIDAALVLKINDAFDYLAKTTNNYSGVVQRLGTIPTNFSSILVGATEAQRIITEILEVIKVRE